MATKAIIRCMSCHEEFPIYWTTVKHEPVKCPNCFAELNGELSEQVIKALATLQDLNVELLKAHSEYNEPLFEVSISHNTYPCAGQE